VRIVLTEGDHGTFTAGANTGFSSPASDQITLNASPGFGPESVTMASAPRGYSRGAEEIPSTAQTLPAEQLEGLCVVLLDRNDEYGPPADVYPLLFGELFDVDAPSMSRPATFSAQFIGLRLENAGGLNGVFVRIEHGTPVQDPTRIRQDPELGLFLAIERGDVIAVGDLALIDDVLVRIDAV
jgi:hypothetical protein